ncbi:MAG: tRNA 4-thiouridine(8) synthase ThiI [Clostridiales bacterium]|nr:tRNA 4-thiouridine(8) synthase ThiI [Clostridiales bacterium]
MKNVLLIKYGEIMLKGLNRPFFEKQLEKNIKKVLTGSFKFSVFKEHGRFFVEVEGDETIQRKAAERIAKVFGIVSVSFTYQVELDADQIYSATILLSNKAYSDGLKTFKVETRRPNKLFPFESMKFSALAGEQILNEIPDLKVDVHKPEFTVHVEVRKSAYIYYESVKAGGGIPVGSSGKGLVLLSGGIDSPVSAYMMAKRGLQLEAIYFHSHPYTTEMAKEKVIDLSKKLSLYCGNIRLHVVNFTNAQLAIYDNCPHAQLTIIMRRVMMKIAERLAEDIHAKALVTGESLGQVASQTLESLTVINESVSLPVFRPLIGMDKYEVIKIAQDIDTFKTSILPYEDCCTVFVAKHPETRPRLERIMESESNIDINEMIDECMSDIEVIEV